MNVLKLRSKWSIIVLVIGILIIFDRLRLAAEFPEARVGVFGDVIVTAMVTMFIIYALERHVAKRN